MIKLVIDTETTGLDTHKAKLLGVSYCHENEKTEFHSFPRLNYCDSYLIAHNGKFDKEVITNAGTKVDISFDTQVAYYLLHIDRHKKLETIVKEVFGEDKQDLLSVYNECTGDKRKHLPDDWYEKIPIERLAVYSQEDVYWTKKLYDYLIKELAECPTLEKWFFDVEVPLVNILAETELKGVKIYRAGLQTLEQKINDRTDYLVKLLYLLAGTKNLNLNSSKQLQDVLYKKFKLPKLKKIDTGYSTDVHTLKKLADHHAFPKLLLEYRELTKIQAAFIKPLQELADEKDRIHACFNQMGTKTRRMSCSDPNLQQIPVKTKIGQEVRKCFIPEDGHVFLIADYSQIELRLLAHFCKEPKLLKAFANNEDIHEQTAKYVSSKLGRDFSRREGKILNFSIIYGKTAYGFAEDWNCTESEAQQILDTYFEYYPRVKEWIEEQQLVCQANSGWIKSLAGLPLYVEGINSNDRWKFEEAKRQAVNYLIQGSSQDILKQAIVNVHKEYSLVPTLIVHDELVYEIPEAKVSIIPSVINSISVAQKLDVPVLVEYKTEKYWTK